MAISLWNVMGKRSSVGNTDKLNQGSLNEGNQTSAHPFFSEESSHPAVILPTRPPARDSQLVDDTLMPNDRKQPAGNRGRGNHAEDGKLEQGRGVGDGLPRHVRYRIRDRHGGWRGEVGGWVGCGGSGEGWDVRAG